MNAKKRQGSQAKTAPPRQPGLTNPPTRVAKRRIFLVDDHPMTREGLAANLNRQADLEVCGEASNPAEAMSGRPFVVGPVPGSAASLVDFVGPGPPWGFRCQGGQRGRHRHGTDRRFRFVLGAFPAAHLPCLPSGPRRIPTWRSRTRNDDPHAAHGNLTLLK